MVWCIHQNVLWSEILGRLKHKNNLNLRGKGCSEPRVYQCFPAWKTRWDSFSKREKEIGNRTLKFKKKFCLLILWKNEKECFIMNTKSMAMQPFKYRSARCYLSRWWKNDPKDISETFFASSSIRVPVYQPGSVEGQK